MKPASLKLWTRPENYAGETWEGFYSAGVGQSRDSNALERSNFQVMAKALDGTGAEIVRERHWAVGWIEWIAIPQSDAKALEIADALIGKLEEYPSLDDDALSREESAEADEIWARDYSTKERLAYIRRYRNQFEFTDLRDLLGCVRGNYFAGYASELVYRR